MKNVIILALLFCSCSRSVMRPPVTQQNTAVANQDHLFTVSNANQFCSIDSFSINGKMYVGVRSVSVDSMASAIVKVYTTVSFESSAGYMDYESGLIQLDSILPAVYPLSAVSMPDSMTFNDVPVNNNSSVIYYTQQ